MIPPEPPVAIRVWLERSGAVKGAPQFGAAKRTLDCEDAIDTKANFDFERVIKIRRKGERA